MTENWYILFVQAEKQSQLKDILCKEGVHAFLPVIEYYRRDKKGLAEKLMFPGYIFIKSEKSQEEFDRILYTIRNVSSGLIKQLKNEGSTALTKREKDFFEDILDENGIAKMSYGHLNKAKKAVVTEGPLKSYENRIIKVDKHDGYAFLDFQFLRQPVKMGLLLTKKQSISAEKKEEQEKTLVVQDEVTSEEVKIDLNDLISKMTQL